MRKHIAIFGLLLLASSALAVKKSAFIVFGDSMSDQGAGSVGGGRIAITPDVPIKQWYPGGRFTNNASNWLDQLTKTMGSSKVVIKNWAVGEAPAWDCNSEYGPASGADVPEAYCALPSLDAQISNHVAKATSTASYNTSIAGLNRIAVVWIGSMETALLRLVEPSEVGATAMKTVNAIIAGVERLVNLGESTVVVGAIPPVGNTPHLFFMPGQYPTAQAGINMLNTALKSGLNTLAAKYPKAKLVWWDIHTAMVGPKGFLTLWQQKGFKTNGSCLGTLDPSFGVVAGTRFAWACVDPSYYAFYDMTNPSAKSHGYIMTNFKNLMNANKLW